jgi:hypothetical protein
MKSESAREGLLLADLHILLPDRINCSAF